LNIALQHISKRFRKDWIFRNVSLELQTGTCNAITGNNGSGKSTLLQIIAGFLSPTDGEIQWSLKQENISRDEIFRHVAICSPALQVWDDLSLEENVGLFLRFKKLPSCNSTQEFAKQIHLENNRHQPLKTYSSGMKHRVKLGLSILSDSQLLLLDEPCSHLDSSGVHWYQTLLRDYVQNRTIVIASNRDERETFICTQHIDVNSYKA